MWRTGDSALSVWMALGGALAALLRMELIAEQNEALAVSFAQYRRCGGSRNWRPWTTARGCLQVFCWRMWHCTQQGFANTTVLAVTLALPV